MKQHPCDAWVSIGAVGRWRGQRGGRNRYREAPGDFPVAALRGVKTQHESHESKDELLHVYQKNARGLTNDGRIEEMMKELIDVKWDILILNETWRTEAREYFEMAEGHIFAGAGYPKHQRGVAIIVHRRWAKSILNFVAINERAAFLDINFNIYRMRVVAAYFPHSKYADIHVQEVYNTLSSLRREAKAKKYRFLIGADCNAEAGSRTEFDDPLVVGTCGLNRENSRGQWLKQWATMEEMMLCNTFFPKPQEKIITHTSARGRLRQIDYILADRGSRKLVKDCGSDRALGLGSDYAAVRIVLWAKQKEETKTKRKTLQENRSSSSWKDVHSKGYAETLGQRVADEEWPADAGDRAAQLESVMVASARQNTKITSTTHNAATQLQEHRVQELIQERKSLPRDATTRRATLSKQISKAVRSLRKTVANNRINDILTQFSGLDRIPHIKARSKKKMAPCMIEGEKVVTTRLGMANVFASFYEELYSSTSKVLPASVLAEGAQQHRVPDFSAGDVREAIKQLKRKRCPDRSGVLGEMFIEGGEILVETLTKLFNDILRPDTEPPESWRKGSDHGNFEIR